MSHILETIMKAKHREVAGLKPRLPDLRDACRDLAPARGFVHALRRADRGPMRLIAEVKHRSPSAGVIV
ncbi:MAG: indole-3-glycerol-phosphate synthase TrpC, partial [Planctomycetia bacterium]|nr:indole-3-glycerol-phosphate synthase TrpC [Planctomycetia bacterium]